MQITLKAARVNAGLTQAEAAEKMGVTTSTICLWESGKADISMRKFDEYCQILGVNRADILLPL